MDHEISGSAHGTAEPYGRANSGDPYVLRRSFTSSSDSVSEAGDIGDRALSINSHMSALQEDITSPLFNDGSQGNQQGGWNILNVSLEYISCLLHLAVFGIFGVLSRHLLQQLFGPKVAGVTSDKNILYLDLPSNMVGSFLMGWFGVVFKGDISSVSEHLAIGLTTGYLGSLTTFSGWNQKMIELAVDGKWIHSLLGFVIGNPPLREGENVVWKGLFLVAYSIIFGIETAEGFRVLFTNVKMSTEGFRWILRRVETSTRLGNSSSSKHRRRRILEIFILMLLLCLLWGLSGLVVKKELYNGGTRPQLSFACLVGPLGVWIRWFLARMNPHGLSKAEWLKWLPFGTLIANVSAACIMAALATTKKEVNIKTFDTVASGIQLGFLGCLSTVSTFIAEFTAMRQSIHPWRAYAYAVITIGASYSLGMLIYNVPVWIN